ncbi:MAG: hypothetical protein AMXMBFR44_5180 [Candidatus Campbellbacteria bacterium]
MRRFPTDALPAFKVFSNLKTPAAIQDFLNTLPFNFEKGADTMYSPKEVLARNTAHCLEGALLAAAILWYHGEKPLLLDLESEHPDQSHVVALFKRDGRWGAISKTNHAVLRYRDPVYKNVRELALSYFNEYFLDSGKKTMRSYSKPFLLTTLTDDWLVSEKPLWHIEKMLVRAPHESIAPARALKRLRKADAIEIAAGKIVERKK